MNRLFYQTKSFWALASGMTMLGGTCFSFAIEAHPMVKAGFAFATGACGLLAAYFVADRVTTEANQTRALVTGTGDGNVPAGQRPAPVESK